MNLRQADDYGGHFNGEEENLPTMRRVIRLRHIPGALAFAVLVFVMAVAPLSAQEATTFRSAVVTKNHYDPTLKHNIPNLQVVRNGQTHSVNFLDHYNATGGITRWGYPTSEVIEEETGNLAQYYQRGVVDWHWRPDLGRYEIERRLAWDFFGGGSGGSVDQGVEPGRTNPNPGVLTGPWGHKVSDFSIEGIFTGFKGFFDALGGVQSFGFPKTDARIDNNATGTLQIPGATPGFTRQYFQAAVLEHHPGDPEPVKLRLLGDDLRDMNFPRNSWQTYAAFNAATALIPGQLYAIQRVIRGQTATGEPVTQETPAQPAPAPQLAQPTPVPTAAPSTADISVWFGAFGGGALHYNGTTWTTYRGFKSPIPHDRVKDISISADGSKWFATENGLAQLRGTTWAQFDTETEGFPGNDVTAVHAVGNLVWIGTADSGVGMYDIAKKKWTTYSNSDSAIESDAIRDILIFDEGLNRVWIATANGAFVFNNGQWRHFASELASNDVLSIGIDARGVVWLGHADEGGLSAFDGTTWTPYRVDNSGLTNNTVNSITAAANGLVWFGTEGGISRYDTNNGTWKSFNEVTTGLAYNQVQDIAIDSSGRVWVATNNGASVLENDTWKTFQTENSDISYDALRAVAVE